MSAVAASDPPALAVLLMTPAGSGLIGRRRGVWRPGACTAFVWATLAA